MMLFLHRFRIALLQNLFLIVGGALCASVIYYYLHNGFSIILGFLWIFSIVLCSWHFYRRRRGKGLYAKNEFLFCAVLVLIFTPVYFFGLYDTPRQIGTDEIATMDFEKRIAATPEVDWFGLSDYFQYPNAMFLFRGLIGEALGGVTLSTMRLQSGLMGFCIVLASYFFFRIFFDPITAFSGSVLLGFNHALIALSRMAISTNVALLHELVALTFLLRGYQKRSPFETFLGGVVAGLAFYHYLPGRIVIGVWGAFLLLHLMFYRSKVPLYQTCVLGGVAVLGFVMAAAPLMVGTIITPEDSSRYAQHQLLILGFFFIYLFFAFFTTKNPNYTRFLIILPFSTALILESLQPCATFLKKHFHAVGNIFLVTAVFYIGYFNLSIYHDYLKRIQVSGDPVGDTARYIEARHNSHGYHFYVATDAQHMYYTWGIESQWHTWSSFFTDKDKQTTQLVTPFSLGDTVYETPFTVFLPQHVLTAYGANLKARFPQHQLHNIAPDGHLQAFEVLE